MTNIESDPENKFTCQAQVPSSVAIGIDIRVILVIDIALQDVLRVKWGECVCVVDAVTSDR